MTYINLTGVLTPGAAASTINYVQEKPIYVAYARKVLELCGDPPGKNVLDVGCGTGGLGVELGRRGARVTFQDIDIIQLIYASTQADRHGVPARFLLGPIEPGVYPNAFDIIVAAEVLEHLPDDWAAVQVLRDALRPEGILVVTAPHITTGEIPDHVKARIAPRLLLSPPGETWGNHDHVREYTEDSLRALLQAVGEVETMDLVSGEDYKGVKHVSLAARARKP